MRKKRPIRSPIRKKHPFIYKSRRKKNPFSLQYVIASSLILFSAITILGLIIVEEGIRPTLVEIARTETQRIGTLAINDAMSKKVLQDIDVDDILQYHYDNNGRLQAVTWNTAVYHEVQYATVRRVQSYLYDIEHGRIKDFNLPIEVEYEQEGASFTEEGIVHMIPLGQATNNALFAHLGPRVPVRFSAIGDVQADIGTKIVETGINNTYIEITVDIEVDVRIVIPFATETEVVKTSIPIANFFHTGEIPEFYSRGGEGFNPAIIQPPTSILPGQMDLSGIME